MYGTYYALTAEREQEKAGTIVPAFSVSKNYVIANQCAHWCGNPLSIMCHFMKFRDYEDADCHVASLLAMTFFFRVFKISY